MPIYDVEATLINLNQEYYNEVFFKSFNYGPNHEGIIFMTEI